MFEYERSSYDFKRQAWAFDRSEEYGPLGRGKHRKLNAYKKQLFGIECFILIQPIGSARWSTKPITKRETANRNHQSDEFTQPHVFHPKLNSGNEISRGLPRLAGRWKWPKVEITDTFDWTSPDMG
jgi:hypothetical protein